MSLIGLLVSVVLTLLLVGFLLWLVKFLPNEGPFRQIATGLVILVAVLWVLDVVLEFFGYGGLSRIMGPGGHPRR